MKSLVRWFVNKLGYEINRVDLVWKPWSEDTVFSPDDEFIKVYYQAFSDRGSLPGFGKGNAHWSKPARCYVLKAFLTSLIPIEHHVAECGTYRGNTAYLMSYYLKKQGFKNRLWLFDSFEGLPKGNPVLDPYYKQGDFSDTSVELVRSKLSEYHFIEIVKGWIPDSLTSVETLTFGFVHVDVDHYQSAMDCCTFFYPKLAHPGIMVFDDYGFPETSGAKRAVDEYSVLHNLNPIFVPSGQIILIRY